MNAEDAMIGTMIRNPYLIKDTEITADQIESIYNRQLYSAMKELSNQNKAIDTIILITTGDPAEYGGASRMMQIERLSNELKFDDYVDVVLNRWREREKLSLLHTATQENWSIDQVKSAMDLLEDDRVDDHHTMLSLMEKFYEQPWEEQTVTPGISLGIPGLQEAVGGFRNQTSVIIAARPSMGKTDAMLRFAMEAGYEGAVPIVFSLEMGAELLAKRMIAAEGRYNRSRMDNTNKLLTEEQKSMWVPTLNRLVTTDMQIFDQPGQTVATMRMKVRRVKNMFPGRQLIVFIDYMTLVKESASFGNNKHLQVSDVSKALKSMAKEFDMPVVTLAQLSRGVEQRNDKRPMMSDLRESGSIEEDGDLIAFLYRDSYYTKDEDDNSMEFIISKNRNGGTGTVNLEYNRYTGVIRDAYR